MSPLRQLSLEKLGPLAGSLDRLKQFLEKNPFLRSLSERMNPARKFSLGIDLGTHALRYVLWDPAGSQVLDWGCVTLNTAHSQQGSDKSDKKEVRSLPVILKDLAKKLPRAQIAHSAVNLQDLSIVTGHLQLPKASGRDPRLVRLAIGEQISFPVEEASYFYSECQLLDPGRSLFHFAAVPRKIVEKLIDPIDEALSLVPDVNLQGYALESLIKALMLAPAEEVLAFLNVGRSTTIVSIFQGAKLLFERHIPLGGQDMTRAIFIMYLAGESPRTAQDLEEAEKVKQECYLPLAGPEGRRPASAAYSAGGSRLTTEENRKLFKVIDGLLAAWVQDIRLSLNFFNENYISKPISAVYLIGGGANLKDFDAYLTTELGIPTRLLHFPKNGRLSVAESSTAEVFQERFHEYAPALAFALKPENYATLTPKEYKTLALEQIVRSIIRTGSIVLFALLGVWYLFLVVQNRHLSSMKATFLKNHGVMEQAEGPYIAMRRWKDFLGTLDSSMPQASVLLKVLSREIPANMLLSRIVIQRERGNLLLEGMVSGDAKRCAVTLSEFSKRLEDSGYFKKIEIPSLEPYAAQPDSHLFRLTADLTAGPHGSA